MAAEVPGTPVRRFDWERLVRRIRMHQSTKATALLLATYANPDGTAVHPGEPKLALQLSMSTRAVRTHIGILRDELGLLERTRKGGGRNQLADEYRLVFTPEAIPAERWLPDPDLDTTNVVELRKPTSAVTADITTELRKPTSAEHGLRRATVNTVLRKYSARTPEVQRTNSGSGLPPTSITNPVPAPVISPTVVYHLDQSHSLPAGDAHPRERSTGRDPPTRSQPPRAITATGASP